MGITYDDKEVGLGKDKNNFELGWKFIFEHLQQVLTDCSVQLLETSSLWRLTLNEFEMTVIKRQGFKIQENRNVGVDCLVTNNK